MSNPESQFSRDIFTYDAYLLSPLPPSVITVSSFAYGSLFSNIILPLFLIWFLLQNEGASTLHFSEKKAGSLKY